MKIINEDYKIYWAHLPEHTNPMTEGYIGITKQDLSRRIDKHNSDTRRGFKRTIHNAIRKYRDKIVWEVLEDNYSEFTAKLFECFIRPELNIGWNCAIGGSGGNTIDWTEERREQWSNLTRECMKSEELRSRISISVSGEKNSMYGMVGYKHPKCKLSETQYIEMVVDIKSGMKNKDLSNKYNLSESAIRNHMKKYRKIVVNN